jgi:uncharacterized protein
MEPITFETEGGLSLQGEIRRPEREARGAAVICHPHPQQGGSKDHPLLWALRNELSARGFVVLSFNFRGVMGSEGEYAAGVGETKDARAAIDRVRREAAGPTFSCGWSFGANVALREALEDDRVGALALIGFPLSETSLVLPPLPDRAALRAFERPVLLLAGEADPFCPVPDLKSLGRRLGRATVTILKQTDHFFWRREREVASIVGAFAEAALLTPS